MPTAGAPTLRVHRVSSLEDRVKLLQKLVTFGEAAFDKASPPFGSIRDPEMRRIGLAVTEVCNARDDKCELMAIYDFVKRNIRYTGDVTNKDTFQSGYRTMQYAGGDCLPSNTKVISGRFGDERVEISRLKAGDNILDDGKLAKVVKVWSTGRKPILEFVLDNTRAQPPTTSSVQVFGAPMRCSPEHKLFRFSGEDVRAKDVRVGDVLLTPQSDEVPHQIIPYGGIRAGARVLSIHTLPEEQECFDITTSTGRFWLPESNVLVHNCDDFAVLICVLAMVNGFTPKFRITSNYGSSWDHIYVMVGLPKLEPRSWIALDGTLPGSTDMRFGKEPPRAKFRDFGMNDS